MAPLRSVLASRTVLTTLTALGCLGLLISTLDKSNRNAIQEAYLNHGGRQVSASQWEDAKTHSSPHLGKALTEYPGRKPRTVQAEIEKNIGYYDRIIKQRHQLLNEYQYGTERFDPWHILMYWWWYFPASFNCPHEIQRVGPLSDGGKWICGMSLYEERPRAKCVLYSFGVNRETRFEGEMLDRTDCTIYAYDASVSEMGPECQNRPNIYFKPYFIGKEDKVDENGVTWRTLKTLMKENGHDWIDILKVDIEGSEFPTFDAIMDDFGDVLPFSQLQIEFHVREDFISFPNFLKWWERLESKGVYPWWTELNLNPIYSGQRAWASEYCFLNVRGGEKNLLIQNQV
ncbi:hypothetical protein BGX28_002503 [Mortierella sp. GBA30]|nr:hypothetical protein BGX28_002503 [Mortierella sp. GBA30]